MCINNSNIILKSMLYKVVLIGKAVEDIKISEEQTTRLQETTEVSL